MQDSEVTVQKFRVAASKAEADNIAKTFRKLSF